MWRAPRFLTFSGAPVLHVVPSIAAVFFVAACVLPFLLNAAGPFVFFDEAEYAMMAQAVGNGDFLISSHSQYGPLYPYLLAALRAVFKIDFYAAGLLINVFAWAGCIVFVVRTLSLLGASVALRLSGAALMIVAPFWSFTVVVWADPLFWFLIVGSAFFLVREGGRNSLENRIAMGVMTGLAFLAKPIGLFYIAALIATLAAAEYRRPTNAGEAPAGRWFRILQTAASALIIVAPWIVRNLYESGSLLGYSQAIYLREFVLQHGLMAVVELIYCFFYQLGYLFFVSFGFFGVVVYVWLVHGKELRRPIWLLIAYLICAALVVCTVSALFMAPHPAVGYWWPNGRYLTHFGPLFILVGFMLLRPAAGSIPAGFQVHLLAIFFLQALIVLLATPLHLVTPAGLMNDPDLGLFFLWDRERIVWRSKHEPAATQLLVSIILLLPSLMAAFSAVPSKNGVSRMLVKAGPALPALVISLMAAGSSIQYDRLGVLQNSRAAQNQLFRNAAVLCGRNVYLDERLGGGNIDFMYKFWCPSNMAQLMNLDEFLRRFGNSGEPQLFVTRGVLVPEAALKRAIPDLNPDYVVLVGGR